LHRLDGELDAAEAFYERTLALARELGDREVAAIALLNLAMVAIARRAPERARTLLIEVLSIAEQTGSRAAAQSALEVCAGLAALREDWERAVRFYTAAEHQTHDTGRQRDPADDAFLRPLIARAKGALDAAGYEASSASGRSLGYQQAVAETREWLTRLV
jgi:hypothetical protein